MKKKKEYKALVINKRRHLLLGFPTEKDADEYLDEIKKVKGWKSGWTKKVLPEGIVCIGGSK